MKDFTSLFKSLIKNKQQLTKTESCLKLRGLNKVAAIFFSLILKVKPNCVRYKHVETYPAYVKITLVY